ncbi:MAG: Trm112 family protein [Pseudomonadota bacterium]
MAFDKTLLDVVACPLCKGKLVLINSESGSQLVCKFDRLAFDIKDDIPILLESEATKLSLDEVERIS